MVVGAPHFEAEVSAVETAQVSVRVPLAIIILGKFHREIALGHGAVISDGTRSGSDDRIDEEGVALTDHTAQGQHQARLVQDDILEGEVHRGLIDQAQGIGPVVVREGRRHFVRGLEVGTAHSDEFPGAQQAGIGDVELNQGELALDFTDIPGNDRVTVFLGGVFLYAETEDVGLGNDGEPVRIRRRLDEGLIGVIMERDVLGEIVDGHVRRVELADDDAELLDGGDTGGFAGFHLDLCITAFDAGVLIDGNVDLVSFDGEVAPALGRRRLKLALGGRDFDDSFTADGLEGDIGAGDDIDGRKNVLRIVIVLFVAGDKGRCNR